LKTCELCEQAEACVEVKHYENGELRALSLCGACAKAHGLNLPPNLADLLLETTLQEVVAPPVSPLTVPAAKEAAVESARRCPGCGMRVVEFRTSGRLGCPLCYGTWRDVLEPMLLGMHRSLVYKGGVPRGDPDQSGHLQQELLEAVAREDYERAARLRDLLRHRDDVDTGRQGEFFFDEDS
jgi:protein arginine kinase activator